MGPRCFGNASPVVLLRLHEGAGARAERRYPAGSPTKPISADPVVALASYVVEIRTLDDTALADDAVMRDFYDLTRRSELHGRPRAPLTAGSPQ